MAQYKTISSELAEREIARKNYLDYEQGKDTPYESLLTNVLRSLIIRLMT